MIDPVKVEAAVAEAVKAERSRALEILGNAEAAGRADLARACITSGLSVKDAEAVMRSAARTAPRTNSAPDFAEIVTRVRADRARHASEIASLGVIGADAALAADSARQGYTAADVQAIHASAKPAA